MIIVSPFQSVVHCVAVMIALSVTAGIKKKELLPGFERDYGPYLIHRLLCNRIGLTLSLHPVFSHTYKRYLLSFVIECLSKLIEDSQSLHQVSSKTGTCRRTLRRWRDGFLSNETAKRACFFRSGLSPPGVDFGPLLLHYFRKTNTFDAAAGAVLGMVRLQHEFCYPLY